MRTATIAVFMLFLTTSAGAAPFNVTLGKPITITGDVGVITCCFPDATVHPPAALETIVDGVLLADGTQWQTSTVWWDERHPGSFDNLIEIDLLGTFRVDHLRIQADNNDNYQLNYRNPSGQWLPWGFATPFGPPGMQLRTGDLPPVLATAFRIDPFGGDSYYSVSELQIIGSPIPEPTTLLLVGAGLGLISARRRAGVNRSAGSSRT